MIAEVNRWFSYSYKFARLHWL